MFLVKWVPIYSSINSIFKVHGLIVIWMYINGFDYKPQRFHLIFNLDFLNLIYFFIFFIKMQFDIIIIMCVFLDKNSSNWIFNYNSFSGAFKFSSQKKYFQTITMTLNSTCNSWKYLKAIRPILDLIFFLNNELRWSVILCNQWRDFLTRFLLNVLRSWLRVLNSISCTFIGLKACKVFLLLDLLEQLQSRLQ